MLRAIERGITLKDFESMTIGMILGYIVAYNNERIDDEDGTKMASQADFDRW